MAGEIFEGFDPLLLILGQVDSKYSFLDEFGIGSRVGADTMKLCSVHEGVGGIDEAGFESHFRELFDKKLGVELGKTVFLEVVEEESSEIVHALSVFVPIIY